MRSFFWWHDDVQKMLPYPPEPNHNHFGDAPMVKFGSLSPQAHPATGEIVDTVSRWDQIDRQCGTVTTGTKPEPKKPKPKINDAVKADIHQALHRAMNDIKWGNCKLSPEKRARCKEVDELFASQGVKFADK